MIKYLIKTEDEVTFWYWQSNSKIETPNIQINKLWNKTRLFILQEFPTDNDISPINTTMRDTNKIGISIEHIYSNTNRYRIVGSAVFKPLFEPPFGSYISYVATNSEMKGIELGSQFS